MQKVRKHPFWHLQQGLAASGQKAAVMKASFNWNQISSVTRQEQSYKGAETLLHMTSLSALAPSK